LVPTAKGQMDNMRRKAWTASSTSDFSTSQEQRCDFDPVLTEFLAQEPSILRVFASVE